MISFLGHKMMFVVEPASTMIKITKQEEQSTTLLLVVAFRLTGILKMTLLLESAGPLDLPCKKHHLLFFSNINLLIR